MAHPTTANKKQCFVVQGFGEKTDFTTGRKLDLDKSYQVIKEAVEEAGLTCTRADEIQHSGTIDGPMYRNLYHADLVIADLSTYNLNAAYELGVRYGVRPYATIILAEDQFKNPFDVSHIVIRNYKHLGEDIGVSEARRFKRELKDAIVKIMVQPAIDSPVYTFVNNLCPPVLDESINKPSLQDEQVTTAAFQHFGITGNEESIIALEPLGRTSGSEQFSKHSAKQLFEQMVRKKREGDFPAARSLLTVLHQMRPHDEYVVQQLAFVTYKNKEPNEEAALLEALDILKSLHPMTCNDPVTLELWGEIHKQLWELNKNLADLEESISAYERGFFLKRDFNNGINYAFMLNIRASLSTHLRDRADAIADFVLARRIRRQVLQICQDTLESGRGVDTHGYYSILVTMWEAAVGLEDYIEAALLSQRIEAIPADTNIREITRSHINKLKELLSASPLQYLKS